MNEQIDSVAGHFVRSPTACAEAGARGCRHQPRTAASQLKMPERILRATGGRRLAAAWGAGFRSWPVGSYARLLGLSTLSDRRAVGSRSAVGELISHSPTPRCDSVLKRRSVAPSVVIPLRSRYRCGSLRNRISTRAMIHGPLLPSMRSRRRQWRQPARLRQQHAAARRQAAPYVAARRARFRATRQRPSRAHPAETAGSTSSGPMATRWKKVCSRRASERRYRNGQVSAWYPGQCERRRGSARRVVGGPAPYREAKVARFTVSSEGRIGASASD